MQADVLTVLWPYIMKALVGVAITGVGALLMYPFKKIKQAWVSLNTKIDAAQTELVQQRTNCLTTLQKQGDTQIELLTKAVETLESIHLDQKQTLGYIQAKN